MREVGVEISDFSSNALAEYSPEFFDVVISCCGCGGNELDGPLSAWKQRKLFQDWDLVRRVAQAPLSPQRPNACPTPRRPDAK